ncbi:hypothetical protein [Candidatus Halobonum tyrrellensis]|uniref:Uncharacterized protein n=1 Tax=Candidatus Halobonum tyrrellensis G22 TaxID=1324957 RepID=V4HAE8_9EURY|nr:hypothetical protein [Candidatus Halobonum tyrrellensis]ESP87028.1 hypothetical protein K933_15952 [Candidatus Halobonum tyrrellensis G22]
MSHPNAHASARAAEDRDDAPGSDPARGSAPRGDEAHGGGTAESTDRDPAGAADGEVAVRRMPLREGGWVGYGDDAVYVVRDDEPVEVRTDDVVRVSLRTVEWDLAVMSLLLVGVGGYVAATRNPLVGAAFALVGVASLYRTYGHRHQLRIHVEGGAKPLTLHPEHPAECHDTLADLAGLRSA